MELISLIQQAAVDSLVQVAPDSTVQDIVDSNQDRLLSRDNWERLLVAIIGGIVVFVLRRPLEGFFDKIGKRINRRLEGFGWKFEKKYLAALARDHQRLKLIGFTDRVHPPLLKDVYVSLRMSAAHNQESRRFNWQQMFALGNKQIVVLGQPGSGKSTLMDYLALIFSRQVPNTLPEQLDKPLPLFVRLRDIGKEGKTLLDLLNKPDCLTNIDTPRRFFEKRLEEGKCLILLDGLDEVLDEVAHAEVVRSIQQLIGEFPNNWYVVTCRVAGWKNQLPNFHALEVQPFDSNDIQQFIAAWYREVVRVRALNALGPEASEEEKEETLQRAAANARTEAASLFEALKRKPGLLRIAQTPLILSLITLVYYADQAKLPDGRANLYKRCLDILLEQWDWEDKKLAVQGAPRLVDKLAAMKEIALHYLEHGLLDMDRAGLEALVAPLLREMQTELEAGELIDHIVNRSGILQEKSIGQYGFAHRALQDYLSAAAINDKQHDQLLLEHVDDEEAWWEVILIATAIVPKQRAERLVEALYEYSQTNINSLIVAGLALSEDVLLSPQLRADIITRLKDTLNGVEDTGQFQRLYNALSAADNREAEQWIQEALVTTDKDRLDRVLVFITEQSISDNSSSLFPVLVRLARETEEASIQTRAIMAISQCDIEADASLLTFLREARKSEAYSVRRAATWAYCELGRYGELGLVKVPAGSFTMGSEEYDNEKPVHEVYLPTYYISKGPVTVEEFKMFIAKTNHEVLDQFDDFNKKSDHPVAWVRHTDALAYAKRHGLFLPSEAEWEKASRGADGRRYPWGDKWDKSKCNSRHYWEGKRTLFFKKRHRTTTSVGSFSPGGDSPYGCVDMSGNVWEWTRSIYKNYPYDPDDGREKENSEDLRVLRGGSFVYLR